MTGISIGGGLFLTLLGLVGAVVTVLILKALNKRLRIFTRGTVSFILAVLIIFTAVDTVRVLNDIRNNEARAKRNAAEATAASVVCTWLQQGAAVAAHQLDREIDREFVRDNLRQAEQEITRGLAKRNINVKNFDDLKLVSVGIDPVLHYTGRQRRDSGQFEYRALVDDGKSYHCIGGIVQVNRIDSPMEYSISIDGRLLDHWNRAASQQEWRTADAYKSPNYHSTGFKLERKTSSR